ncbi:unnamed protein product [Dicrocoelium dendriticum]|nr:unnamed protein product [Dicrocoelium dendriticum]
MAGRDSDADLGENVVVLRMEEPRRSGSDHKNSDHRDSDHKDEAPQPTLHSVLHFLQTEWARMEAERSVWEIDRAELKANIRFLEGERRGQENLKQDLIRRIKMLEYALKQERVKFDQFKSSVSAGVAMSPGTKPSSDDCRTQLVRSDHEVLRDRPLGPGEKLKQCTENALESKTKWSESRTRLKKFLQEVGCTEAVLNVRQARVLQLLQSTPGWRDALNKFGHSAESWKQAMRGEAPSYESDENDAGNEGIQQALSEMDGAVRDGYSVSSSRPIPKTNYEVAGEFTEPDTTGHSLDSSESPEFARGCHINRFRRIGGDRAVSAGQTKSQQKPSYSDAYNPNDSSVTGAIWSFFDSLKSTETPGLKRFGRGSVDKKTLGSIDAYWEKQKDLTTLSTNSINDISDRSSSHQVTLNDRRDLAADNPSLVQLHMSKETSPDEGLILGDLATLTVTNDTECATEGDMCDSNSPSRLAYDPHIGHASSGIAGDVETSRGSTVRGHQLWSTRYTLRGHFDGVRDVVFHPAECAVYTAGEDGCVMLWNLTRSGTVSSIGGQSRQPGRNVQCPSDELEPVHIYVGHKGPVLCLAAPTAALAVDMSTIVFSGGLDGTVRGWRVPPVLSSSGMPDLYAPHDLDSVLGPVLTGSKEAVWSVALHPSSPVLTAAHADGSLEFWLVAEKADGASNPSLLRSVQLDRVFSPAATDNESPGRPTCLHYLVNRPDSLVSSHCLVGTSTGWLFLMDVQTGQVVSQCSPAPKKTEAPAFNNALPTGWTSLALNGLTAQTTLSLVIGAHEDGCVRFYDFYRMPPERSMVGSTPFIESMVAHVDSVTCLDIDPQGLYLLTGSHDASIRVWDMETRACVQEVTNHRVKYNEAIHAVALHERLPLAASAGADGVCKIYCTSS